MISTVVPFLIRGMDTAYGAFVVGAPRSDPRRSVAPLLIFAEDPLTGPLAAAPMSSRALCVEGFQFDLSRDRPHEADELARDGSVHDRRLLAARQHATISPAQTDLRL